MLGRNGAIIFEITDGDGFYHRGNVLRLTGTGAVRLIGNLRLFSPRLRLRGLALRGGE